MLSTPLDREGSLLTAKAGLHSIVAVDQLLPAVSDCSDELVVARLQVVELLLQETALVCCVLQLESFLDVLLWPACSSSDGGVLLVGRSVSGDCSDMATETGCCCG